MKSFQKPFGDSIWILNGRLVLARVCNYSLFFLCKCTCDCRSQCIMSVPMQMETEGTCALCMCVSLCLCLRGLRTSHDSQPRHNTHRQVWELGRVRAQILEHGLAEQIFLSFPISVSLLLSMYSLFPTVPNTEGLFVIQSRKCNWSQICPAFCLISSLLCSCRLPSSSPCLASVSETHGNKWSSDKIDLVMSWVSDFKCSLRWHLG